MRLRVRQWKDVFVFSALITALAVAVPLVVVSLALWQFPMSAKLPILVIAGAIPLFIAFPISVFALYLVRLLSQTIAKLDNLIRFDPMTGLLSRTNFLQSVNDSRAKGGVLILLDADHFKKVNDTYGHDAGDAALKFMANAMVSVVGSAGFVGRLGGEEFAIYMPIVAPQQVTLLMAALGTQLRMRALDYHGIQIKVTMSMGIVVDPKDCAVTALIRFADQLLYRAKAKGRDCYEIEEVIDEADVFAA